MADKYDLADIYLLALDFKNEEAHKLALNRAHQLRKFEIENYWKRSTYFWAFQIAAFAFLGLLVRSQNVFVDYFYMAAAGFGLASAFVAFLSSEGSKFWQENWEAHVDALESPIEGNLTKVIFAKNGMKFSVSRLNTNLFKALFVGWAVAFILVVLPKECVIDFFEKYDLCIRLGLFVAAFSWVVYIYLSTRTKRDTHTKVLISEFPDDKLSSLLNRNPRPRLFIRNPIIKRGKEVDMARSKSFNWYK